MNKDWNGDYEQKGIRAQRLYPNESLLQFMGQEGLLSDEKKARILEIGCGSGANLWMIAKEGHGAYGIDISKEALRLAEKHLKEKWNVKATLREGSFTDIPFPDEIFDYVVDVVSMQHIYLSESANALQEIKRVLKPGGKYFSVRLGDESTAYYNGMTKEKTIDAVTIENIGDPDLPLCNNGTISFWSPGVARIMYNEAKMPIVSIERNTRTYSNGKYRVEYLVIVAQK